MAVLEDVRVLDLSRLLPGPFCSLMLADLGADVIRLEHPSGGDYLRLMPPSMGGEGAFFQALNRNKRSIAVDLKRPEGVEAVLRLIRSGVDVVIESFRPGVMERLGLGYEKLEATRKGVVLCSITGYGQTGPRRDRAGHDLNYIGLSGLLGLTGVRGGDPVIPGAQVADVGGGALMALAGVLAALHRRNSTGKGAWLDISMTEGALAFLSMQLGARQAMEEPLSRGSGPLSGEMPCYSVYRTADDRHMTLAALEPRFWSGFCAAVSRDDLLEKGFAFGEEGARTKQEVARIFAERTQADWVAHFANHDVCCEPVHEGDDVFEDEHFHARDAFARVAVPEHGSVRQVSCPVRFAGERLRAPEPSPRLGEHTDEVLLSAGLDPEAIEALRASKVVL